MPTPSTDVALEIDGPFRLGPTLQAHAGQLARSWRARVHAAMGSSRTLLLDGAVDSFIFELGRAVDGPRSPPSGPWTRIAGVLRIPQGRALEALEREFNQLRALLSEVSDRFDAPEDSARLTSMVDVAMAIALLHHQSGDAEGTPPGPRFGGLKVQIFEDHRRAQARLRRAA